MAAGIFKAKCLAVMDQVRAKREAITITKRGRPVVKLVPADEEPDHLYNFLRGKGSVTGDIIASGLDDWGSLK
jgi:prevent-host-death family protein